VLMFTKGKQRGYGVITDPALGQPEEIDSCTCGHCGRVVWMKPFENGAAMGGLCTCCDKYICPNCVGKGCSPLQKKLEQWERRREYEEVARP
jgi:hypothetical protein